MLINNNFNFIFELPKIKKAKFNAENIMEPEFMKLSKLSNLYHKRMLMGDIVNRYFFHSLEECVEFMDELEKCKNIDAVTQDALEELIDIINYLITINILFSKGNNTIIDKITIDKDKCVKYYSIPQIRVLIGEIEDKIIHNRMLIMERKWQYPVKCREHQYSNSEFKTIVKEFQFIDEIQKLIILFISLVSDYSDNMKCDLFNKILFRKIDKINKKLESEQKNNSK